ncbi:hypothetical protein NPIL_85211 [Nephila pilipes]|uniref:Uncharacterized protein n=1 Tax=Nephila pilipes TaxID=299642 RepID=A0A8X6QVJ1_NEPPI|nr:hypothetical protein NPIL_85211 [Nephila pilipes]
MSNVITDISDEKNPRQISTEIVTQSNADLPETSSSDKLFLTKQNEKQSILHSFFLRLKKLTGSWKEIEESLSKLFFLDFQQFSIVKIKGFIQFVKALNPEYKLTGRRVISNAMIQAEFEKCKIAVLKYLLKHRYLDFN